VGAGHPPLSTPPAPIRNLVIPILPSQNGKPDALSRRSELRSPKEGGENQPVLTVLHEKHFEVNILDNLAKNNLQKLTIEISKLKEKKSLKWDLEFLKEVKIEGLKDKDYRNAFKGLKEGDLKEILHEEDGMLFRKPTLWVPTSLRISIIRREYDSKVAGHMGQETTKELIRRNFWWPKMNEHIVEFVRSCPECQKNKSAKHKPYGLLQPLDTPYLPWQSISMDFITLLPLSEECDQLWVIVDRFSKM
jgi:hypothetical protein